ncbi:MAG: choice-of-anchor J domain-containing protein [Prevotellaceae bacterium]|jgi:hypothetical protein|nr:choice-of-anchor J domain-containing protein [Prevotellaceae bacterium]
MQNTLRLMLTVCTALLTMNLSAQLKAFSDSFESGGLSLWTQAPTTSLNSWEVSNAEMGGGFIPNAHDGAYYARVPSGGTDIVKLITPMTTITALPSPILTFVTAAPPIGAERDTLAIYYRTTTDALWTLIKTVAGSNNWATETCSLVSYLGGATAIQIAFEYRPGNGRGIALDKVAISASPNCSAPSDIRAVSLTSTSVRLAWLHNNAESYYLKVSSSSLNPPDNATADGFDGIAPNTYQNVTGLTPATTYYVYVKAVCEYDDNSAWTAWQFTTACPAKALSYSESFDNSGTALPDCWKGYLVYTREVKKVGNPPLPVCTTAQKYGSSGSSMHLAPVAGNFPNYADYATKVFAVSPPFEVEDITTCNIKFQFYAGGIDHPLHVGVMTNPNDINTFEDLYTILPSAATTWELVERSLSTAVSGGKYIAFMSDATPLASVSGLANYYRLYIDDLVVEPAPECPKATALTAENLTSTGASLTWTGDADKYKIAISTSPMGLPITDITQADIYHSDNITSKPFQIPVALTPKTTYYLYVQLDCDFGEGEWASSTFTTIQTPAIPPYSKGFEDPDENALWTFVNGTQTNKWSIGSATHNGGSKSLYISADDGITNSYNNQVASNVFARRTFSLNADTYIISLDWKANGENNVDNLRIFLAPPTSLVEAGTLLRDGEALPTGWISLSSNNRGQTAWQHLDIVHTVATAGYYDLVLYWKNDDSGGNQPPAAVDNISVVRQSCVGVSALASSSVTANTATVSWTSASSSWHVKVSTSSLSDPDTGTGNILETSVTSSTLPLTVLSPVTTYYVYVQADCGTDDVSLWSNISFTTLCGVMPFPFSQNFAASTFPPACWERRSGLASSVLSGGNLPASADISWQRNSTNNGITGAHATLNVYNSVNEWLITPPILLNVDSELTFDLALTNAPDGGVSQHIGNQPDDRFLVIVSTDEGTTWTSANVTEWNNAATGHYAYDQIPNTGQKAVVDLSPYTGQTVKIAFYGESTQHNGDNSVHIGNISVHTVPSCRFVSNTTVENITETTATLTFVPAGVETAWQVALGAPGFDPDGVDVTPIDITATTHQLTELTPATGYALYVRANCGSGEYGQWIFQPVLFRTKVAPAGVPYSNDFENDTENNSWLFTTAPNSWSIGTAAFHNGKKGLYVHNAAGNYTYDATSSTSFAYRQFNLPAGEGRISFDWKSKGSTGTDLLPYFALFRVFLVPASETLLVDDNIKSQLGYTPTGWIDLGDNTLCLLDDWKSWTKDFTVETAGLYNLVFLWINEIFNHFPPPAAIDDITLNVRPVRPCAIPAGLSVSRITSEGARVVWSKTASKYDIKISATPIDPETVTAELIEDIEDGYFDVYGRQPNTTYYIYVRAYCGETDGYGYWSDALKFTTSCAEHSVPYTEHFNTSGSGMGAVPDCWRVVANTSGIVPPETYTFSYLPYCSAEESSDGDNYSLRMYAYYDADNNTSTKAFAVLPPFSADLSALQMEFSSYSSSANAKLSIGVLEDVADISTFEPLTDIDLNAWKTQKVKFNTYEGEGKFIAFLVNGDISSQTYTTYIDGIKVDSIRDCQAPINPRVTDITDVSARIVWESLSQLDTVWQVQVSTVYVENVEDADTITNFVANKVVRNTRETVITGLYPQKTYFVYLRTICEDGNAYSARYPYTVQFTTECVHETYPYTQSFEGFGVGTGTLPECWKAGGTTETKPYCSSTVKYAGTAALYFKSTDTNRSYATLPAMSNAISAAQLYFTGYRATGTGSFSVGVMTDPADYATFEAVATIVPSATSVWEDLTVSFESYSGTGKYIALVASGIGEFYIDNVILEPAPTCQRPKNLKVTAVSVTSATVIWEAVGTPVGYEVTYGPAGFDPTVSGTLQSAATTSAVLTGLHDLTAYDVYVRAICGVNDTSAWRGLASFITLPAPATVPFRTCFENATENTAWFFSGSNSTGGENTNKWRFGTAAAKEGTTGLYISNNNRDNTYSILANVSYAYAYRTMTLTSGVYEVQFYWRANGEGTSDLLRAFLIPAHVDLSGGGAFGMTQYNNTAPANWIDVGNGMLNGKSNWEHSSSLFALESSGDYNLTFFWKNDGSGGNQPPAAIDSVSVTEPESCYIPILMTPSNVTDTQATLSWASNATAWHVKVSSEQLSAPENVIANICDTTITGSPTLQLSSLSKTTSYYWYVRAVCQDGQTEWSAGSFETPCGAYTIPFTEGFGSVQIPQCWSRYDNVAAEDLFDGSKTFTTAGTAWKLSSDILPGQHAWVDLSSSGIYSWLITPPIIFPSNGSKVSFDLRMVSPNIASDRFMVAVSPDAGATWSAAHATVWDNQGAPNTLSEIAFALSKINVDLAAHRDKTIRIAFYIASPDAGSGQIHLDNIHVSALMEYSRTGSTCQGYDYNGHGFSIPTAELTAGTYHYERIGVNTNDADSLIKLTLTVLPSAQTNISATICEGSTYTDNGFEETEEGIHYRYITTTGCDSVVRLHLTVIPAVTHLPDVTICEGGSYTGNGFVNLTKDSTYERTGGTVPSTTCDSIIVLRLHVEETVHTSETIEITVNDLPYIYRDMTILAGTVPDNYVFTFHKKGSNGCDSIHTLNLLIGTGLSHTSVSTLNLTPNPVLRGGEVRVSVDFSAAERKDMQIEIFNSTGIRVLSLHPDTEPIVLSGFDESGIYVVRITTGTHGVYYGKLVVQ